MAEGRAIVRVPRATAHCGRTSSWSRERHSAHLFARSGLDPPPLHDQNRTMPGGSFRVAALPCLVVAASAFGCLCPSVAWAQIADVAGGEDYEPPAPQERDGAMIGLGFGYGYAGFAGYPNKLTQIGDAAYRAETGGVGSTSSIWLGIALRDWVTFGIGVASSGGLPGDKISGVGSIGVRVEGYPFFSLGGFGHDLGLVGEFGVAGGSILAKDDKKHPLADGGSMGFVGLGVFWEAFKIWHLALGPAVQYSHGFSESMHSNAVTLGLRTALYWTRPH